MTVKSNVIERGDPSDPTAPKKFYPSIVSGGRVTLRQLAKDIATISTVSSTGTMAVLEALLTPLPNQLAKGNIWLRSSVEGADVSEDVPADQINAVLPRLNPGKEFKKALGSIEYQKT